MGNTARFKVAALDDDRLFLDHLAAYLWLETQIDVVKCGSDAELMAAVSSGDIDAVLLDYDLGVDNGINVADRLRSFCPCPPPAFLLTGGGSERTAVKAFRSGFADYFSKRDFRPKELLEAISESLEQRKRDAAIEEQITSLKQKLDIDPDTGLRSASYMRAHMEELVQRGGGIPFAALMLDATNLPAIRAQLGHQKARQVVHRVATRIGGFLQGVDIAGRYNADTILVLIKNASSNAQLGETCAALHEAVSRVIEIDRNRVNVQMTLSAALFPADGSSTEELLEVCSRGLEAANQEAAASGLGAISLPQGKPPAPWSAGSAGSTQSNTHALAHAEGDGVAVMSERRKERRQRVLKRAQVIVRERGFVVDCIVRDLSPNGARLRFDAYFAPPQSFSLHIFGSGETRKSELRWQIGNEIGVELGAAES